MQRVFKAGEETFESDDMRDIHKKTKHIIGTLVLNGDGDFLSAKETFLRDLEEKIKESTKGFKSHGITLEFLNIEIK